MSLRPDALTDFRRVVARAQLEVPIAVSTQAMGRFVHPIQWMLEQVGDTGIPLTAAGYLPPAVVSRAMNELGWAEDWYGAANREIQCAPVLTIRQSMQALKLLHRRKGVLLATPLGRRLNGNPQGLWELLARSLTQAQTEVQTRAWEFFLLESAAQTGQSGHTRGRYETAISRGLWSIGWVDHDGDAIAPQYVFELIVQPWRTLRWLGAFTNGRSVDGWSVPTPTMIAFARYCLSLPDLKSAQPGGTASPAEDFFGDPAVRDIFDAFEVVHKPGMAADLMKELAPLLAAEGIDLARSQSMELPQLNAALSRAMERSNCERFTANGKHRSKAFVLLRLTSEAFAADDFAQVDTVVAAITPDPGPDGAPSVAHVIGLSLGLLDTWYTAPERGEALTRTRIAKWHSPARKAATDMIALARKGRAFDSIQALHGSYNGLVILQGSILAIAATLTIWADYENTTVRELGHAYLTDPGDVSPPQ